MNMLELWIITVMWTYTFWKVVTRLIKFTVTKGSVDMTFLIFSNCIMSAIWLKAFLGIVLK